MKKNEKLYFLMKYDTIYLSQDKETVTAGTEAMMNRQSNKITALYCRIASYYQDFDASIARSQMDRLLLYAKEHDLQNPQLFCDWGFSGITQDRPEYQRMIREVKSGNVSSLVVLDFSRLGREYEVCRELLESILPRYEVTIHSIKDLAIYTPRDLRKIAARGQALEAFCQKSLRDEEWK